MLKALEIEIGDAVARVWMNRPHVHNALDETLVAELTEAFLKFDSDPTVRVIVLGGRGKSFTAGGDLKWMERAGNTTMNENLRDSHSLSSMLQTVRQISKPTVARVHGAAIGAGTALAAACDIAIASQTAVFGTTEVRFGLVPDSIAPHIIDAVGIRAATRLLLCGERFAADEAFRIGLVHEIAAPDKLDERVSAVIQALLAGGPNALAATKRFLHKTPAASDPKAQAAMRAEAKEGLLAFVEKRKPAW